MSPPMHRVIGFDVSSSNIGYCIIDYNETSQSYYESGIIKPPKDIDLLLSLSKTKEEIISLIVKHHPTDIAIEDIISYMPNKSNAGTIIKLAVFNRMVGLACYEATQKLPCLYSVMKIRHGLKVNKVFPSKEEMPELVAKHLNIKFPYVMSKATKTRPSKIKSESYDIADGMAVALYHARNAK